MKYSIGIVGHVDRQKMIAELSDKVKPDLVSTDDGTLGCAGNHAFVQSRLAYEPGWSVILEDDAVPLYRFNSDLEQVLEIAEGLHPDIKVVGLYLGTGYPANWQQQMQEATKSTASFIRCPRLLHAVGYAVAPEVKRELAAWMLARGRKGPGMAPDEAITVWLNAHRFEAVYTNPSLVDHQDTRPVVMARPGSFSSARKRPRRAWNTRQRLTWTDNTVMMSR